MKNTLYQLVYKSCYHGELYDNPRAIPVSPQCPACDILEIIEIDAPDYELDGSRNDWPEKNRRMSCGGIGSYFTDKEAAIAALREMD